MKRCPYCQVEFYRPKHPEQTWCSPACWQADVEGRFWQKVNKAGPVPECRPDLGPCWVWTASTLAFGYGHFSLPTGFRAAHRIAYEWLIGPIPEGLQLDHLCRNPPCVNPRHLEPVTSMENVRRGACAGVFNSSPDMCPRGHPLAGDNLYLEPRGRRICRICYRAHAAGWRARNPERNRARHKAQYAAKKLACAERAAWRAERRSVRVVPPLKEAM